MIQTSNLTFKYPGSARINFPDFKVDLGDILLISGESGCGKTTLLHLLAGIKRPSKGEIVISGKRISDLSPARLDQFRGRQIGIIYQESYFIQSLNILDNLVISPYSGNKSRAEAIASRLMLQSLLSRYPSQLSTGQQQRVSIARAIMTDPSLILADEPTSALDNKNCTKVLDLLREEATTNGAALIIVTHDDRLKSEISNYIELEPLLT